MSPFPYLIHYLAIYQLVFLGLFFLMYYRHETVARFFVFLVFCLVCLVVIRLPYVRDTPWLTFTIGRPASAFAGALWLLTYSVFADRKQIPSLAWWMLGICVACRAFGSLFYKINPDHPAFSIEFFVGYLVPQVIWLGFCLHASYIVLVGYKLDLIERRRIARLAFIVCIGTLISFSVINGSYRILAQFLNYPMLNLISENYTFLGYLLVSVAFSFAVLRLRDDAFFSTPVTLAAPGEPIVNAIQSGKDQKLIQTIKNAMEVERLYTKPGLTISELATHLREQEHKLRLVINKQLQFNNFSHFLNEYRISDAVNRLKTTEDAVSKIGLDVGYSSLSSFHKAFKEQYGVTPREFRVALRVKEASDESYRLQTEI